MFALRDYQTSAVKSGLEFFQDKKQKNNAVIVLPTGAGKSLVIASICSGLDGYILVLQPSKEILEQNYKKTVAFGCDDIGIYSASFNSKKIRKITFATVGSIYKKPELFERFAYIIVDECHSVNAKEGMYKAFFAALSVKVLGLTASPYRMHKPTTMNGSIIKFITRTRPRFFKDIIHITQNGELFNRGYLSRLEYKKFDYDSSKLRLNSTGADFDDNSVRRYHEQTGMVQKIYNTLKASTAKYALVFCSSLEEAGQLNQFLSDNGASCAFVHGKTPMPERSEILEGFKAGKIKIVVNVGVLTTGFDFPELDCIILARPTNSVALYYQMVGRGIRIAPDKLCCQLIDLCGNVDRFGKIEDFEIVGTEGKYRLKSAHRFLTGIDMLSGEDCELVEKPKKASNNNIETITYGKFSGTPLPDVPLDYLEWVSRSFDDGRNKSQALREIARRVKQ